MFFIQLGLISECVPLLHTEFVKRTMDVKVEIDGLRKTYGSEVAVDNLSTKIKSGTIKSLLGPSGCGKTTTLRCIAGLEKPDRGEIYINNELVSAPQKGVHRIPQNRDISMVFQSIAIWPHMTVYKNVQFPLRYKDISKKERQNRVTKALESVGLGRYSDNLATELSGGQQQRVALARALVSEPEVLLFDEPLSNLDAQLRREMRSEVKSLHEEFDITMLYVTHSQDEALFLSDEIAIMNDGNIIEESETREINRHPNTYFGMNFLGRSNTIEGEVIERKGNNVRVKTDLFEITKNVKGEEKGKRDFAPGDKILVCIRPKEINIFENPIESNEDSVILEGTVVQEGLTQNLTEFTISTKDIEILVQTTKYLDIRVDDLVHLSFDSDFIRIFHQDGD